MEVLRLRSVKVLMRHVFLVPLHYPNALVLCSCRNLDGPNVPRRQLPQCLVLPSMFDHNKLRFQLSNQSFPTIPYLEQLQFQQLRDLLLIEFRLQEGLLRLENHLLFLGLRHHISAEHHCLYVILK